MKKISMAFSLLVVLLLSGCANKLTGDTAQAPAGAMPTAPLEEVKTGSSASVGYIDFESTVATKQNFNELNIELDGKLDKSALDSLTQVALIMNNHREDLSAFNYKELSTLDGISAQNWQQTGEQMGGHHVSGILTFPRTENPRSLVITGMPVGNVNLTF